VAAPLIDLLIRRFEESRCSIVVPVYQGRRGHPVVFARSLFDELIGAPDSIGARRVVWDHADEVLEVPTEDRGIVSDIDTPEQYQNLIRSK
jgi:molybdenum cofactor cytidylyltransferase